MMPVASRSTTTRDPAASFHINNMGGHVGMLEMHGRWQVGQDEDVPSSSALRQTAG